jgi:hypothetical protein
MAGVLDGHSLARFVPGVTYDVTDRLARQLIAMNGAVEDPSTAPELVVAEDEPASFDEAVFTGGIHVVPALEIAADRDIRRTSSRVKKPQ